MDLSYRTWEWSCKSLFSWSTLFLDMQVNTEGGLQGGEKENVPYCRNGIGSGCRPHPLLYRKTSPNTFLFLSFLILFYSKKRQHTDRLQRTNNIEKMNKGEEKHFYPLSSWQANCEHFYSLCWKDCKFLQFWHEKSSAVNMQDEEWRLLTRHFTMLWAQCAFHLIMASLLGSDTKLYKEQKKNKKKHILYLTNLYAYFTIYFYYHFNKYKTTLWFKRKQWVLKRH